MGRSWRTKELLRKLRAREAVTVLVVGGSITNRHAGCTHSLITCLNPNGPPCCGLWDRASESYEASAREGTGWARLFVDWLQSTWPPREGSHRLYNAGVAGAGNFPEPFVMCWMHRFPAAFDLAIVETMVFVQNRPQTHDPMLEHLLRQLLAWNGLSPTVMLMPGYNWCQMPSWHERTEDASSAKCRVSPTRVLGRLSGMGLGFRRHALAPSPR